MDSRCGALLAKPALPTYEELYGLRAAAIAVYPDVQGSRQSGWYETRRHTADTQREQVDELKACWNDYDFLLLCISNIPTRLVRTVTLRTK